MDEKSVATRDRGLAPAVTPEAVSQVSQALSQFQTMVAAILVEDRDFGRIPGIQGDTLLDAGANLIINSFNAYPGERRVLKLEAGSGLVLAVLEVPLISRESGQVVATGVGAASTLETKHRYRWEEHPEDWGYDRKGLKSREKEKRTSYRIPNPEPDELINTILKMASKRAEVDAAMSLPGVPSALKDVYEARRRTWAHFWGEVSRLGLRQDQAHRMLGAESIKNYLAQGHSHQEALEELRRQVVAKQQPAQQPPPATGAERPTDAQRARMAELMKEGNWSSAAMRGFLQARIGAERGSEISRNQAETFIAWMEGLNHLVEVADREYGTDAPGVLQVLGAHGFSGIEAPVGALEDFRKRMAGEDSGLPWE